MRDALRAKVTVIATAAVAFAFGMGMASALDLTPFSLAAGGQSASFRFGGSAAFDEVDISRGFSHIVEQLGPTVVTVRVEQPIQRTRIRPRLPSPFDQFFDQEPFGEEEPGVLQASGSGFIIREDGYIVTNNHVVEGAERVEVQLSDRRVFQDVEVVGRDPTTDIAVLKVEAGGLMPAPFGYSDSTEVGEWVLAIGSPGFMGAGSSLPGTVTAGIVSAKGRNIGILAQRLTQQGVSPAIEDFIQTDAVINPGNSGGPLVNGRGQVIGVNTAIMSTTGVYQGYGFAVPIELVRDVVSDLIEHGTVRRAVIGVTVDAVSAYDAEYYGLDRVAGAKVNDVGLDPENPGPAAAAGIERGDIILAVEGEPVESVGDLQRKLRSRTPGETVTLTIVRRDSRERDRVRVRLAEAGAPPARDATRVASTARTERLGAEVRPLTAELRRRLELPDDVEGVVITGVERTGPLGRANVQSGMLLVDVNGEPIRSVGDYQAVVSRLEPGGVANLLLYNPGTRRYNVVTVPLPRD